MRHRPFGFLGPPFCLILRAGRSCPSLGRNRHQIARSNCRLIGALIGHPHRRVWVPTPADIIQTDSHFELVTQRHSGGVAALLRRFLLRLGPHKQSRGPFYDKGDPPCGSFTSGGFVHCSSTHSFNLTASKGRALRRVQWSQRVGFLYL